MNNEDTSPNYHHIRRSDRAMDDEWIRDFLHKAPFGVLGTAHQNQPFHNLNLFVYDEDKHAIYIHTALEGRTPENISNNPRVCFSTGEMGRLLPADTSMEFSVEYDSVILFGNAELIKNSDEAQHGLQMLLNKYFPHLEPGKDYRSITPEELNKTAVFRISISSWSGKQKKEPAEFAGAFNYNERQAG